MCMMMIYVQCTYFKWLGFLTVMFVFKTPRLIYTKHAIMWLVWRLTLTAAWQYLEIPLVQHLWKPVWDFLKQTVGCLFISRYCQRSNYREWRVWDPINWFNSTTFLYLFHCSQELDFHWHISWSFWVQWF